MPRRPQILLLLLPVVTLVVSGAQARADGASVDKTGWWNRANVSTATPAGPVTVPPPPGVPAGDLAVSFGGGQQSAIAAVGIQPDDEGEIISFTLSVREDPDASGNQGTGEAAISACPITAFWAGGENGEWDTRPEHDCEAASVAGVRDDDGLWTFDLRTIGALWFDPFGTIEADGVVLVPSPDASAPFQAVFSGGDDIEIDLRVEPTPDEDDFTEAVPDDAPVDAGLSSGPSGGGASLFSPPVITRPPTTLPPPSIPPAAPPTTDSGPDTGAATPTTVAGTSDLAAPTPGRSEGQLIGNYSPGVVLGLPVVLALLIAMSYWLGPAGQPLPAAAKQRGVSRALEAQTRASKGI